MAPLSSTAARHASGDRAACASASASEKMGVDTWATVAAARRAATSMRAAARMVVDDAGCGGSDGRVQTLSACREPSPALPPP